MTLRMVYGPGRSLSQLSMSSRISSHSLVSLRKPCLIPSSTMSSHFLSSMLKYSSRTILFITSSLALYKSSISSSVSCMSSKSDSKSPSSTSSRGRLLSSSISSSSVSSCFPDSFRCRIASMIDGSICSSPFM